MSCTGYMASQCLQSCGMCLPVLPRTQIALIDKRQPHHSSSVDEASHDPYPDQPQGNAAKDIELKNGGSGTRAMMPIAANLLCRSTA